MITQIIDFSVRNKFVVGLFTLALLAWGMYSMRNLPIDAVPDITNNQVQVVTVSPSLAPQEVEQFITYPVEMAMANIQGVDEIRSISRYGLSVVTIVFEDGFPVLDARQLVSEMLDVAAGEIPEEYGSPELMPITTGLGEIYQYTIEVEPGFESRYDITELRVLHDWIVKRQLSGVDGIVEISGFGGYIKQYEVAVNPNTLREMDITMDEILSALENNNQNTGGSYIQKGPYAWYVRAEGLLKTPQDIETIVVKTRGSVPVLIRDVAKVRFGHPARFGAMTKDGKGETVGGITLMLKGGNANQIIDRVKERMERVKKSLPEGVTVKSYLDRSELVSRVIKTITTNLTEAALIVIFVLVLLLGNFRAGLIVGSVIPLSLLFAFSLMQSFGVSASIMSLGAIDFGLIVDGTIIILESTLFFLHRHLPGKKLSQQEMDQAVIESSSRVGKSAAFGILIILIVYFPILSLTGIEGKMFKPMALTIAFALVGSLILSITYVPMLSAMFLSKKTSDKENFADKIVYAITNMLMPVLNFSLARKKATLFAAVILFGGSIFLFSGLGAVFIPSLEEGDLAMQMAIPPGSSLDESINIATKAEKVLLDNFPEVKSVVSKIGTAEVPTDPMAIEDADIMIILKDKSEWTSATNRDDLANLMKEKLDVITGAEFNFTQPIQLRFNELITGAKADVVVKIYGDDLSVLATKADEVVQIAEQIQGAADVKAEVVEGLPQLVFNYDRKKMALYGLAVSDVNAVIKTALAGQEAGVIFEGERKFDLVVRMDSQFRQDVNSMLKLFVRTPTDENIPLSEIVSIDKKEGPMQIARDDTRRRITIGINVRNRDIKSLVEELQAAIDAEVKLPPGYNFVYGGQFENLEAATSRLMVVLPVALGLIFVLLFFTFGSMKHALVIYSTIPLSIIGGIASLWLRGLPFSISAGIGFIALFGVAVLNGIVLINQFNRLKDEHPDWDIHERIRRGVHAMIRPVSLTTLVASLGFIPMAISTQAGAEVQRPLATVVIGGLLVAAVLTIAVLPVVYYYFENKKVKLRVPKTAVLIITFLGLSFAAHAQQDTVRLSLEDAQKLAFEHNLTLKNSDLQIEKAKRNKAASFDLGETEFAYDRGQINSSLQDYSFSVNQNLGNLFQLPLKMKTGTEKVHYYELEKEWKQRQVKQQVAVAFWRWQWAASRQKLLSDQLKKYSQYLKAAELKFKTGESSMLEKMMLESQYNKLELSVNEASSELHNSTLALNQFLATDSICVPNNSTLKRAEKQLLPEGISVETHPELKLSDQSVKVQQKELRLAQTDFLPEFSVGYLTQQIDGEAGFKVWQVGVSVPILFWSKLKTVQAAKLDKAISENEYAQIKRELSNELAQKQRSYQQLAKKLDFFEQKRLKQADEIQRSAELLYQNGEIGYVEYIHSCDEILEIRSEYLDALLQYNQIISQLTIY